MMRCDGETTSRKAKNSKVARVRVAGLTMMVGGCLANGAHATNIVFFNDSDQVAYFSFGGDNAPQGTLTVVPRGPAGPLGFSYVLPVNSFGWDFTIQPRSSLTGLVLTKYDAGMFLFSTGDALIS